MSSLAKPTFLIDLQVSPKHLQQLVSSRVEATNKASAAAQLVLPDEVHKISAYRKFSDVEAKENYRRKMVQCFETKWATSQGSMKARETVEKFVNLAQHIREYGAAIFASILKKERFETLISQYNKILLTGSKSWIHSYTNLKSHLEFLLDKEFNAAFLHPMLIALISYEIGGPIRVADARGKDSEPVSVSAREYMLHLDNTPFNDEYKIILTWERNKCSGSKGQNFVFLPGTHKGVRNCTINEEGSCFSTENATVFIDDESIDSVLEFQMKVQNITRPVVVEVSHATKPTTTIFSAGSLVHHCYQTNEGVPRSSIIVAFHRVKDNPGQFVSSDKLVGQTDLNRILFGKDGAKGERHFLKALSNTLEEVLSLLQQMDSPLDATELVKLETCTLSHEDLMKWKLALIKASKVEEIKPKIPLYSQLTQDKLICVIEEMMKFDKHGSLDLILYSDNHEEIRKWARNRIREMKSEELHARLHTDWADYIQQPHESQLLSPHELQAFANQLADIAHVVDHTSTFLYCPGDEKDVSCEDAYRSINQFLIDLGQAVVRCGDTQEFLSTCLFLFWACDTLMRFKENPDDSTLQVIGKKLLGNYITTAIMIAKFNDSFKV